MPQTPDPASSLYFQLIVDGQEFGTFDSCDGLGVEVEMEEYREGGNNGYVTRLPTRLNHSTLTLTRAVYEDSPNLTNWVQSIVTGVAPTTMSIALTRADRSKVATWDLLDAKPSRWKGPTGNTTSNSVATESLEIVYHGFLNGGS